MYDNITRFRQTEVYPGIYVWRALTVFTIRGKRVHRVEFGLEVFNNSYSIEKVRHFGKGTIEFKVYLNSGSVEVFPTLTDAWNFLVSKLTIVRAYVE